MGAVVYLSSCSSSRNTGPSAGDPDLTNLTSQDTALTLDELNRYETGLDSAVALFDFGDVRDFLAVRDSLRQKLIVFAQENPSVMDDPEFVDVLTSLDDLDSLDVVLNYPTPRMSREDSLALALDDWPEIDSLTAGAYEPFGDTDLFPEMANDRIEFWIRYFTGNGRATFQRAVNRMQIYRPTIEPILAELELPQELIVVAFIESGFNLKARSTARAVGPWQFIPGTARIYGLRVNWWFDERRDIIAATYAAGNYLTDLYGIWESWPLALAAYNCGEYRVARAVARHDTQNFWKLDLPRQTERYVPKFLATLYILRDPDKYGFTIPNDVEPLTFDKVRINDATDLKLLAKCADTSVGELRQLNPSLLRWTTPPKMVVEIKVAKGSGEATVTALEEVPASERVTWRQHRIRNGETLSTIATKYETSVSALKELNGIRNAHRIRAGRYLVVPMPRSAIVDVASTEPAYKTTHREIDRASLEKYAKKYKAPANTKRVVYRVKSGDTLGEIAESYRTRASRIRAWNNLSYRSYIYPGQKLVIYVPQSYAASPSTVATPHADSHVKTSYVVRKGDTIYSISKRFGVEMSDVLAWNNKTSRSKIYPGQTLEIWQKR
jgi:membrane-bound lytic murein transglycosylase D